MLLHRRSFAAVALIGLLMLGWPRAVAPLCAFGAQGHHVIARIAWALMTPTAQDRAAALLDGRQDAFVASSTWADEIRSARPETYNWHFVDIPVGQARYDAARDCPATERGDCVVGALARARADLAAAGRPRELRVESLKFLVHFVGDVHQPLHAIDNHDRGGNDVKVAALRGEEGRATNLHSAWDTGLINLSTETEAARADRLLADLKARPPAPGLDVAAWAEQSHDTAERVAYSYPGFSPAGPPADAITLDEPYRARALAAIDRQLALAGVRLAALLNAILGGA
jgi:nuclease S1